MRTLIEFFITFVLLTVLVAIYYADTNNNKKF